MLEAIIFATEKHAHQTRKEGIPYILHPLTVAKMLQDRGFSLDYQLAALFHDLLEDTDATEEEILNLSNPQILQAVKLVTKEEGYVPQQYKMRIMECDIARMVKLADRLHNLESAVATTLKFQKKYILDTETYYLDMAKGTLFEKEIHDVLAALKRLVD